MIREVFGLIYSLNLRLPTRFIILDKAVATLASVGIELYPDFNVFEVAKPYARSLLMSRYTPQRMATRARRETLKLASVFAEYPYQVHDVLEEMRDGQFEVGFVHKGLDEFMHKLDVAFNRLIIAFVVGRRADRVEPDRRLRDERPAGARAQRRVGVRVLPLRRAGALALWGVFRSGRI